MSTLIRTIINFIQIKENQNILSKFTSFFLDEIEYDFGQLDLVCSIYKNNKFLCESFPENLSTFLINNISVIGRQQRFLKLFKIILTYKDQKNRVTANLIENQIKIIQWFLPKEISDKNELQKYQKLLYCHIDNKNKLQITFNFEKGVDKNGDKIKDVPFYYHAELLDLFIQTLKGDESSSINVSKLKKVFPQQYLLDLLLKEDAFVPNEKQYVYQYETQTQENKKPVSTYIYDYTENFVIEDEKEGLKVLKPKIVDFLLAVYFNEDKPVNDSMKDSKRFQQLCEMELGRLQRKIDQHPQDYIQYVCGKFLKIIIIRENQQDYKDQEEYEILLKISKKLYEIRFQFDEMLNKQEFQVYYDFMREVDKEFFKDKGNDDQLKSAEKPSLKKNENGNENKVLWKAQYNWKIFLNICRNSDIVKETIDLEMSVLAESILKVKDMFPEEDRKKYKIDVQYQEILKKLIQYLQLGIVYKANPENMIFVFNLLEQILNDCEDDKMLEEMQNLLDQLDATKVCLHLLSDSKQNPIEKKELLNAILKFMIKLLEGGNQQIQGTVYDYVMTFSKSEVIFQLFHSTIHDFIEDLREKKKIELMKLQTEMMENFDNLSIFGKKGLSFSRHQSQNEVFQQDTQSKKDQKQRQDQQSINYKEPLKNKKGKSKMSENQDDISNMIKSQTEMEYDEDKDPYRKQQKMINSHILMRVLRVLQLFCEGHNLDLQNYIRYQRNSRTNYDMVSIIIELLDIFYKNIDEENFQNMIKCLDTLIEFVQGPCKMNQETIIDSKFFEFAESILEGYDQKKHDKQKMDIMQSSNMLHQSFTSLNRSQARSTTKTKTMISMYANAVKQNSTILKPWMVEQIKHKTMILVTSLIELNSEPLVIKRIMRSLPLEILKKNLIEIFKKHKKLYDEDQYLIQQFEHHEGEPPENATQKEEDYYNYIIETGFYIFFLLSYYTDLDSNDLDAEISTKLDEIKKDFKDSKVSNNNKGIVKQLYNFVYSLLSSIFHIVRGISNRIQKEIIKKNEKEDLEVKQKILQCIQLLKFQLHYQQKQLQEENQLFKQGLSFFNKHSGSIEIIREGKLERIRFILLPFCHYLQKQNKTEFHDFVDRDSIHSKLSSLVEKSKEIIEICKHEEQLSLFFNRNKFIGIFANSVDLWRDIAFILTILINIFILLSYSQGQYKTQAEQEYNRLWRPTLGVDGSVSETKTKEIFRTTGIIMIVCSTFVVLFFLCKKAPLYLKRAWEDNQSIVADKNQMSLIKYIKYLIIILSSILKVLTNPEVVYYLMYGTLAFIATYIHPFFFAFHLTEFLLRFPTLRNILKSVSDSLVSLILTFVLIIMLFYFQSVIAFLEFYEHFNGQCEQLYLCVFHTFIMTFQNNGGIGGYLDQYKSNIKNNGDSYNYSRFFFDNISFFSVMLITVQIFAGIIIDKFSYLREKELEKNNDIFQSCFICGHSRELFERQSDVGFDQHIKQDHYQWNYLFYIAFLNWKEKTDHSGIESFIQSKLEEGDHSWFPIQRALVLKDHSEDDQEDYQRRQKLKQESENFQKHIQDVLQSQKLLQDLVQAQKQPRINAQK